MGLFYLTFDAHLAAQWRKLVEEDGLDVRREKSAEEKLLGEPSPSNRIIEIPWRVKDGTAELRILQASYRDPDDERVHLIFMPPDTPENRQLFIRVKDLLIAAGGVVGPGKRRQTG